MSVNSSQSVQEGGNGTLRCNSTSSTVKEFRWTYRGQVITQNVTKHILKANGSILTVLNISQDDIGDYICVAYNDSVHVPRSAVGHFRFTGNVLLH